MKVLAHIPQWSDRVEHYATEDQGYWFALCRPTLREHEKTSRGIWELRDKQPGDAICESCKAKKERRDNPPPPKAKLPCTKPDKLVTLWTRQGDERALTHAYDVDEGNKSHCGVVNEIHAPDRWTEQHAQPAHLITCELCMKAAGLWPNWPPHKHRKPDEGSKHRLESRRELEAEMLKAWNNTGLSSD